MIATNIDILEYTNLVCKAKQFLRNVFFQVLEKIQLQLLFEVEDIMSTICFTLKNILQLRCASQPYRSFIENLLDERCTVNLQTFLMQEIAGHQHAVYTDLNSDTQISEISAVSEELFLVPLANFVGIPVILIPSASGLPMFPLLLFIMQNQYLFCRWHSRQYLPIQIVKPKVDKCFVGIHQIHLIHVFLSLTPVS